ncbi:MAG: DNA-3-methyladenine glycosylase family protein [Vulcanimicrobiaceae bacterium]
MKATVPVLRPYRLDLNAAALRRAPANAVDLATPDGRYLRALSTGNDVNVVDVRQPVEGALDVRINGRNGARHLATVATMLGANVDVERWYVRARPFPWLDTLARRFRGVKPPRYPTLWEALCHGIVFQQLSIHAGAAIMRRLVTALSRPVSYEGFTLYPFPSTDAVLRASEPRLQSLGLSRNKAAYVKDAAAAIASGDLSQERLERLSTAEAAIELGKIRGIGPWSSAVILLRGLGRLDTFPLNDSGVARGLLALSGDRPIEIEPVLTALGDVRGMLYFHLLLARTWAGDEDRVL